jgi:hypothetical protein
MSETRCGLINYPHAIADRAEMHPKAKEAVRQAAMLIRGITDDEFKIIERRAREGKQEA